MNNIHLANTFRIAEKNIPKNTPGIAKKKAYKKMVVNKSVVLYPSALSIPNSKVFYSTSESINEYMS